MSSVGGGGDPEGHTNGVTAGTRFRAIVITARHLKISQPTAYAGEIHYARISPLYPMFFPNFCDTPGGNVSLLEHEFWS